MESHRVTDRSKTLKLSGNKVVVPLKPEVYDKDDVPDNMTQEHIELMEMITCRIIRSEIAYCVKGMEAATLSKDQVKLVEYMQRLKEAQDCLDYQN